MILSIYIQWPLGYKGAVKSVGETIQFGIRTVGISATSPANPPPPPTMNRLMGRDSNRGRYALLANDWNNNTDLEHAAAAATTTTGGGGGGGVGGDDPCPDKRYIVPVDYLCVIKAKMLAIVVTMCVLMVMTRCVLSLSGDVGGNFRFSGKIPK